MRVNFRCTLGIVATLTIEVAGKPSKAGIDPVNKLIDRRPDDNIVPVTAQ